MNPTLIYIEAFKKLVPFEIKFKTASWSQKLLAFLVRWYIPSYLTNYTTVIGKTIYFPDERMIHHLNTRFTIAHEVVHLLDQKRLTTPLFLLMYLSPQIFAVGILSFPWLGADALWFLIFGLPWPSPGRVYLEARAYGLELSLYQRCGYKMNYSRIVDIFQSPGYYFMSWSSSYSEPQLVKYFELASCGNDTDFVQIVDAFKLCEDIDSGG